MVARSQFKLAVASIVTAGMLATLPLSAHAAAPAHHFAIDETAGVCNGAGYTTLNRAPIQDSTGKTIAESRRNGCNNNLGLQWNTVVSYIGTQRLHAEIWQDSNTGNDQHVDCNSTGCTTNAIQVSNSSDATAYGQLTGPSGTVYFSNPWWV